MEKETGRVEAFSDGVFAIAITLLVLEFRVPELEEPLSLSSRALGSELLHLWPSAVALVLSFFTILVMWINHHEFMRWVRKVDYRFLFANGLMLLIVTFVPFPTAVLARYLDTEAAREAAAFYCGTFVFLSLAFNLLYLAVAHQRRLVHDHVADESLARVRRAYRLGMVVYVASLLLSLWHPALGLGLCTSLWILWTRLCYGPMRHREPSSRA